MMDNKRKQKHTQTHISVDIPNWAGLPVIANIKVCLYHTASKYSSPSKYQAKNIRGDQSATTVVVRRSMFGRVLERCTARNETKHSMGAHAVHEEGRGSVFDTNILNARPAEDRT